VPLRAPRPLVAGLAGLAVTLSGLAVVSTAAPAQAVSPDLVISQVYGGGGNAGAPFTNDYVELYNRGDQPVSLDGKSLQYTSATGTGNFGANSGLLTELSGTVEPGAHFLVQEAGGATGAALPTPDLTDATPINMSGSAGKVALVTGVTGLGCNGGSTACDAAQLARIVDLVGYGNANFFEGSGAAPGLSNTTAGFRAADGEQDTDDNAADFQSAAPDPRNSGDAGEELVATDPADVTGYLGLPIDEFDLAATGGAPPYAWTATGLPDGVTVSPEGAVSGTPTEEGSFTVTATVTDGEDAADEVEFTITVNPALAPIPIAEIQGDGAVSDLVGDPVITEGVVTAAYPSGGFFGFYLQTEGTGGSVDPATRTTSDGIFVRQTFDAGPVTVEPGDFVQVFGTVTEFAGQTQVEVTDPAGIEPAAGTPDPVTPVTTTSWPATDAQKEALEGMLYSPEGDFTITNNFATNSFGELGLAVGDSPLIQPTQVARPNTPEADAVEADNAARAIILDDGSSTNFIQTGNATQCAPRAAGCLLNGNLTPPYISNDAPYRVEAVGTFDDDVILTQGGSPSAPTYRFEPTETVVGPANSAAPVTFENTRTEAPDEGQIADGGDPAIKVASFNVLNYFTTLGDQNDDNVGDGGCTAFRDRDDDGNSVSSGCDQRGAWDPQDLSRQQEKIVSAINALDADVVGLMEIENSLALGEPADEATQTLVAALNAEAGAGTWAANPSSSELPPAEDMDVITNAIIYKPAAVTRLGEARALGDQSEGSDPPAPTDEPFANAREPIAQAFAPTGDGAPFMVVVNHFKSKGSPGPFPGDTDQGDGQGAGNVSRVKQATALAAWIPTVQGEVDDVLLLGDFNSYAQEDPLHVLYDEGYVNLEEESGNEEYSYSFSGLSGSLDHVLANASALERFTGSDVWNINAVEPLPMEYSRFNYHATNFHQPGPYRSSDHDPVIVGLDAIDDRVTPKVLAQHLPFKVRAGKTRAVLGVAVLAKDERPTGTVTVTLPDGQSLEADLWHGLTAVLLPKFNNPGTYRLEIAYSGDDRVAPSTIQHTVRVVR